MKEREDYRTAEFSTWRSHSVLMSEAGVPPQCRAQQVVNFLRASVPRSVIAERRMLTSHHTGIHNLFSNFAKDEGQKKITPQTTNCNLHHTTECPRRSSPTQLHTNLSFFFPFLLLPTLRHRCKNSRFTRQEAGWKFAFFRGACTILCLF